MDRFLKWCASVWAWLRSYLAPETGDFRFTIDFRAGEEFDDVQPLFPVWSDYPFFLERGYLNLTIHRGGRLLREDEAALEALKKLRKRWALFSNIDETLYEMSDGTTTRSPEDVPPNMSISRIKISGRFSPETLELH